MSNSRQAGLGVVELFLGSTVLAVAVLGTVGGLMTSLKVAIDSKDESVSKDMVRTYEDGCQRAARTGFEKTLAKYDGRRLELEDGRTIVSKVILDETCFHPPIDLNGDGDFDDHVLTPRQVDAAYLETTIRWGHERSFSSVSLVSRPRPRDLARPAK